jgi:hypothetical protein
MCVLNRSPYRAGHRFHARLNPHTPSPTPPKNGGEGSQEKLVRDAAGRASATLRALLPHRTVGVLVAVKRRRVHGDAVTGHGGQLVAGVFQSQSIDEVLV